MSAELVAEIGERRAWRSAAAAVRAMRPQQWTKNLLLFAGIVFAAKLGDGVRWAEAAASFALYCAASRAAISPFARLSASQASSPPSR